MNVKVLIYAKNDSELNNLTNLLEHIPLNVDIKVIQNESKFREIYKPSTYNMVFIDQSTPCGLKLSHHLKLHDPQQKLILLSNKCEHLDNVGCTRCKKELNRQMFIIPSNFDNVKSAFFNTGKCEGYKQSEIGFQINKIVKELNFENYAVDYCTKKNQFQTLGFKNTRTTLKLINKLERDNIPFKIIDSDLLEVLK